MYLNSFLVFLIMLSFLAYLTIFVINVNVAGELGIGSFHLRLNLNQK